MFLMHQHRFTNIENVVVLSGLNTLTLEGLPDDLATEHGRYYYSYEFNYYMNKYNEDLKRKTNSYASAEEGNSGSFGTRVKHYFRRLFDRFNAAETILSDDGISIEERVKRAAWYTTNTLEQWQLLLSRYDAKLTFVLQPLSTWSKTKFHKEEEEMFAAIDGCANNFWRLFGKLCTPALHKSYSDQIMKACKEQGIQFANMNELLRTSPVVNENIYVDHLHFNDLGYNEVGRLIHEKVLKK